MKTTMSEVINCILTDRKSPEAHSDTDCDERASANEQALSPRTSETEQALADWLQLCISQSLQVEEWEAAPRQK